VFPPVEQLIPHRGPAIVISRVLAHRHQEALVEALIEESGQYVAEGIAAAPLALELAAQAVAALVGLERREGVGPAASGYVVGVQQMKFFGGDFRVGDRLEISVRLEFREGPVGRFGFEITDGSSIRTCGSLTVYEPPVQISR
jgi:predicted hotdog family 3-hydroxylacyl-ACP dehydratase